MTARNNRLRHQAGALFRQALSQADEVSGSVLRTVAERLHLDIEDLRQRRGDLVAAVKEHAELLVEQQRVPIPQVVQNFLGRVNGLLESWSQNEYRETSGIDVVGSSTPHETDRHGRGGRTQAKAEAKSGPTRPRRTPGRARSKKPRRSSTAAEHIREDRSPPGGR